MRKSPTSKKRNVPKSAQRREKNNRGSRRKSQVTKPQDIRQRQQLSSGTETSSLDPHAKFDVEPSRESAPTAQKIDSGDLQRISDVEDSTVESTAELADEGQDFEAERVEAIEDSAQSDGKPQKPHQPPEVKIPKFKDRNRL